MHCNDLCWYGTLKWKICIGFDKERKIAVQRGVHMHWKCFFFLVRTSSLNTYQQKRNVAGREL